MELAFVVYVISVLSKLSTIIGVSILISLIALFCSLIWFAVTYEDTYERKYNPKVWEEVCKKSKKAIKISFIAVVVLASTEIVVPSEKTLYTMAGAYAAQTVATNPKVQDVGGKVLKIIEQKLESYIDEGEEEVKKVLK